MNERVEFPLSFAQQRLWFLDQLEGPGAVYTIRLPVRLTGPLDRAALQAAVDCLVARHESLRTTFVVGDHGDPVQVIASRLDVPVQWHAPASPDADAVQRLAGELSAVPFDLSAGPLLRVHVLQTAPGEHLLLLLCHHIVSDAWSSGILFGDLAAAYDALAAGEVPRLPALPVQYADYAVWQRDWLAGPELERQLEFWRAALAGAPPDTPLPTDRPRPPRRTYRGRRRTRVMPAELVTALHALARDHACTLFMVLLAAFNVLLSRYTGRDDICVGSPIAGRQRTELEGLVGLFVNTLVLRTDLSGRPGFDGLLARVRRSVLAAFAHQELPFEKLVEDLQPVRDQARSPLFQVMFILQNTPWGAQPIRDLDVRPGYAGPVGTAKFDLTVSAHEYENELWVNLEYNTDLFDEQTIDCLAESYERVLRGVIADPQRPVHELELLSAEDLRGLADQAGCADPSPDESSTVHGLIAAQAERTPDARALECDGRAWTYRQLLARATALAECLEELLPRTGSPFVAICTGRGPAMMTALLGVLESGAAYVPLDRAYPAQRLRHMLEDSGAGLLVTQAGAIDSLPAFDGAIVLLSDDGRVTEIRMPTAERAAGHGEADAATAYLIYTSGSTGTPKGVRIGQRAVVNFLQSMAREPGLVAGDRLLAVTTLSFDIAVLELLLPLTVGATVIIAPTETAGDGHALAALIRDSRPTVMQATPTTWRLLHAAGWDGAPGLKILCGGEPLDPELAQRLLDAGRELWNLYGPTETTIWSTCARVTQASAPVPIGRPIARTTIRVLDAGRQPVPVGVVGELYIGGLGLADGYHDRPELTESKFINDPFREGQRLFRTGDRARLRHDGTLELLGRLDRQVKLRGFRIELGEVEAVVQAQPGIDSAAVRLSAERLVAWVVPKGGAAAFDERALRAALRDRLPAYMMPAHFVALDALPLTANGKVDRRRLPEPDVAVDPEQRLEPRGPLEAVLAGLFAEVLGRVGVGVTMNFFDAGGHSLLATRLVARIRDVLAVDLPLRALFDEPTVAGLAGLLASGDTNRRARAYSTRADRIEPRDETRRTRAPASLMQQRLWFLDQLEPGSSAYHLAWCLRLVGELDRESLQAAVQVLVARHEILRTTFRATRGVPQQCIAAERVLDVECTVLPAGIALQSRLKELARRPFALETGPLLRVHVIETGAHEHVLLLVIHHIIADGWSMSVLFGELSTAYNALRSGKSPDLPPLPVQYADYAVWQRERLGDAQLARQAAYWRAQLQGAPARIELPTDRPRPAVQSHRGARVSRHLSRELAVAVNALARDADCTLFMVLVAAFAATLGRYAGTHDVVIGTPIAGRGRTELEGSIGFFVNTLVLRTRLDGNPTVRELLARVRQVALDAYAHPDLPFEQLVDELRPERNTGHTPIFQVMFNLHNEPAQATGFDALETTPMGIDRGVAKFDLTVSMTESPRGLFAHLEYNCDLFAEATIVELADYLALLLETFVADPGLRLNALPSLSAIGPAEPVSAEPVSAEPVSAEPGDRTGDLVSRFVEQVRRAPQAIAVRTARGSLSYGAVNEQANAIAEKLRTLHLAPDPDVPRVGLMGGPDPSLVVGLVGILKAGHAWVPLDPAWPAARLSAIVDDAGLAAMVTDTAHAERARALSPVPLIELDGDATSDEPPVAIDARAPACIIYTSGTTGTPRGVLQTRSGIVTQVGRYAQALGLVPADRLSGLSGFAYDAAIQDIFGALLTGASVCLYDVHGRGDRDNLAERTALVDAMVADGITVVHAAPSLYRYLFGGDLNCSQDLSNVRLVVLGGEPVRRSDFELFRSRFARGTRFVNGLGLTESTLALQFHADHDTRLVGQSVPVGDAVAGLVVELVDEYGNPGWFGEIVLTGAGLSPGYWRQPALTAERFGPGPVLRTGDIGRRLPDGRIIHVGRKDEQLNIRGYRVEPGEIEAALGALDGIADCAVTVVERHGDPWLVAWAVSATPARPDQTALRDALSRRVPGYMVPQAIEWLDVLPRRANGKIARDALPAPQFDRETPAGLVPARSELEAELLSIWRDVLQQETIGVHDDFFALGGHSLMATRVIARIRDRLSIDVPLIHLFEHPTIAGFAAAMTLIYGEGHADSPGESGGDSGSGDRTGPGPRVEPVSVIR